MDCHGHDSTDLTLPRVLAGTDSPGSDSNPAMRAVPPQQQQQAPPKAWSEVFPAAGPTQLLHLPVAGFSCIGEQALQRAGALLLMNQEDPSAEEHGGERAPSRRTPTPQPQPLIPGQRASSASGEGGSDGTANGGCASAPGGQPCAHAGGLKSSLPMQLQACMGDEEGPSAAGPAGRAVPTHAAAPPQQSAATALPSGAPMGGGHSMDGLPGGLANMAGADPAACGLPYATGLQLMAGSAGMATHPAAQSPGGGDVAGLGMGPWGEDGDVRTSDSGTWLSVDSGMLVRVLAEMEAEGTLLD